MKGHEEIERILASYRDATAEERARADAHMAGCPACAVRLAAFEEVDAKLAGLTQPALPPGLNRPLAAVIAGRQRPVISSHATGIVFGRGFAPAAIVLVVLVALSVLIASLDSTRAPVTSTPTLTLTTTLTPTMIVARQTEPAALAGLRSAAALVGHRAPQFLPTPAPVPEPRAENPGILLAGYGAHATMTH